MKHFKICRGKPLLNFILNQTSTTHKFVNDVYVDYGPDLNFVTSEKINDICIHMQNKLNLNVFNCQEDILGNEPELYCMEEGIRNRRIVVLFISAAFMHDENCKREFRMAFDQCWPNDRRKLILVILETGETLLKSGPGQAGDAEVLCFINSVPEFCLWDDWEEQLLAEVADLGTSLKNDFYFGHAADVNAESRDTICKLADCFQHDLNLTVCHNKKKNISSGEDDLKFMKHEMKNSAIIVLFITSEFLTDTRCIQEFNIAFNISRTMKNRKVVLVFLEQKNVLLKARNMDSDILEYMELYSELCIWDQWEECLLDIARERCLV